MNSLTFNKRVLLVIPCYNCSRQVVRLIKRFSTPFILSFDAIVIIDNNSNDETISLLLKVINENSFHDKIKVFKNDKNYDLGGSFKLAIKYAQNNMFDYFIFLHGDDQAYPEDVLNILGYLKNNPMLDAILGARFQETNLLEDYSRWRLFGNIFFNLLFSLIYRKRITDIGSGLNLYKVNIFSLDFITQLPNNIAFDVILLKFLIKKNIKFFPIRWKTNDQKSNISNLFVSFLIFYLLFISNKNKKHEDIEMIMKEQT